MVLAATLSVGEARATVYDWSSSIPVSPTITGSGVLVTQNTISTGYDDAYTGYLVTSISGTYDGVEITGLLAPGADYNDNLVYTSGGVLDYDGLGFSLAPNATRYGTEVNLYYTGQAVGDNLAEASDGVFTLTVAATPEPSTWALMILGLAGTGGVARRRRGLHAAAGAVPRRSA